MYIILCLYGVVRTASVSQPVNVRSLQSCLHTPCPGHTHHTHTDTHPHIHMLMSPHTVNPTPPHRHTPTQHTHTHIYAHSHTPTHSSQPPRCVFDSLYVVCEYERISAITFFCGCVCEDVHLEICVFIYLSGSMSPRTNLYLMVHIW